MRRKIVSLLGSGGEMSATRLMSELDVAAGNFYYHLNFISPLIIRKKDGLYVLNEAGRSAYRQFLLQLNVSDVMTSSKQISNRFIDFICLNKLVSVKRNVLIAAIVLLIAFELSSYATFRIIPIGFFIEMMHSSGIAEILLGYSAGLILFVLVLSVQLRALKKPLSLVSVAMAYIIAVMPFAIFGAIIPMLTSFKVGALIWNAVFLCFQAWSATILISHLSKSLHVTLTSAGQMSLLCIYANLAIILLKMPFSLIF